MRAEDRQARREKVDSNGLLLKTPCQLCGEPTISQYGICTKNPVCIRESRRLALHTRIVDTGSYNNRVNKPDRVWSIVAALQNTDKAPKQIAEENGVSRARVHQLLARARASGMTFKYRG